MGSAFILAPHARLDDGLLDIVYASYPVRRRDVIPMVLSFLRGTQLEKCRFMEEKRGREVMIRSDRPELVIHTEGEFLSLENTITPSNHDGLHFDKNGQKKIADTIYKNLNRIFKQ